MKPCWQVSWFHWVHGDVCCRHWKIKIIASKLSKNGWVMPFFVIFRLVREKLLVTVTLDHPVHGQIDTAGLQHPSRRSWKYLIFVAIKIAGKLQIDTARLQHLRATTLHASNYYQQHRWGMWRLHNVSYHLHPGPGLWLEKTIVLKFHQNTLSCSPGWEIRVGCSGSSARVWTEGVPQGGI